MSQGENGAHQGSGAGAGAERTVSAMDRQTTARPGASASRSSRSERIRIASGAVKQDQETGKPYSEPKSQEGPNEKRSVL